MTRAFLKFNLDEQLVITLSVPVDSNIEKYSDHFGPVIPQELDEGPPVRSSIDIDLDGPMTDSGEECI